MGIAVISGEAETIFECDDEQHVYRISRTSRGFLVSSRQRSELGTHLVTQWLHKTEEAALALVDSVKSFNVAYYALLRGLPITSLLAVAQLKSNEHARIVEQLNDPAQSRPDFAA